MQLIRYAIRNILRNIWLSASSLLIIGLLVFFVHILLLVIFSTDRFITSINDRISININLQDGYDNSQIRSIEFLSGVTMTFSGVQVDYISREDALTLLTTRNPDLATLIEKDANPLPNSIRLSNIDIDLYSSLNVYIGRFRDILQYDQGSLDRKLLDYRSQYDRIASVVEMLHILQIAVYILLGLFIFTVAIVIYMVIHNFVFFLQDEVRIIELVGGRSSFIYGPFVIQGMLYAMIATALATIAFVALIALIRSQSLFADFVPFLSDFASLFTSYAWLAIPLFALLGALSAFLASWKYIHSTIGE
jgi:cell division transport system permease protein